jgi:hypothetical protein
LDLHPYIQSHLDEFMDRLYRMNSRGLGLLPL